MSPEAKEAGMTQCAFCEAEVSPADPSTHQRIVAWERKSLASTSRRGGSDVVLREHLDVYCCGRCVERLRSGLSVRQESLL